MKALPEKYYLSHFNELMNFLRSTSMHLFTDKQRQQLEKLSVLNESALCLLLRIVNRKSEFVFKEHLHYDEITDVERALNELLDAELVKFATHKPPHELIKELKKQDLQQVCINSNLENTPVKSAKKQAWVEALLQQAQSIHVQQCSVFNRYVYSDFKPIFELCLFIYFGKLGGTLSQFSMRDLGVLNVHEKTNTQINAHFDEQEEAQTAFYFSKLLQSLKTLSDDEKLTLAHTLACSDLLQPTGFQAESKYNTLTYKLAVFCLPEHPQLATQLMTLSGHVSAQEKLVRTLYAQGDIEACKQKLDDIIEHSADEGLLIFAEDFSRRKFGAERTSILTNMLRSAGEAIPLDEAFVGSPEQGLIDNFARQGITAIHCENVIWRALFCLTFWPELYEHELSGLGNEFSRLPKPIKENIFYDIFAANIEKRLASFSSNHDLYTWLLKQTTAHYGKPNGFIAWYESLFDELSLLVKYASIDALCAHLRAMAKNYKGLKDGYPDLICVKGADLFCVEVKAPGDSLRRNQLVTMNQLLKAGFDVSIKKVEWQIDPAQPYVIIDVETTGGKKEYERITEVAMVKVIGEEIVEHWSSLVNPNKHIPKYITELTGIDNQMVRDAPEFVEIAEHIASFTKGCIFVAHNVNFDMGFIRAEFARCGMYYKRAKLCTVSLGRKFIPGHKSYSLGNICKDLDINLVGHHRALNDAMATAELFIMINQIRQKESDLS